MQLESHAWQPPTSVLGFSLKVTICYERTGMGHRLMWATVSVYQCTSVSVMVYLKVKINKHFNR